jgi:hypothetical protein
MRPVFLLPFLLVVAACSSGERESAAEPVHPAAAQAEPDPLWRGPKGVAYGNAYRICSVFTVKEVARENGVRAKPRAAARAHARALYAPGVRKAAFVGCRDGFHGRPPRA